MQLFYHLLPPLEIVESLLAVLSCAIVFLRSAIEFFVRRDQSSWTAKRQGLEVLFWVAAVFVAGYFVADVNRAWGEQLDRPALAALTVVSSLVAIVFSAIAFLAKFGESWLRPRRLLVIRVGYMALVIGAAIWFVNRTYAPTTIAFSEHPADSLGLLDEASDYVAITDNGSQLPLFEIDLRERSTQTREYLANSTKTPSGAKVIPRADASINANCHGWVFTGGKYLLKGRSVDLILAENDYTQQQSPEPGDVIVYRSHTGECLHTGIVSGILLDGTCMIESKWGIAGRYLHQAEDQPYGLNYSFYRSSRGGHLVTIVHKDDAEAFLTNAPKPNIPRPSEGNTPFHQESLDLQPSLLE